MAYNIALVLHWITKLVKNKENFCTHSFLLCVDSKLSTNCDWPNQRENAEPIGLGETKLVNDLLYFVIYGLESVYLLQIHCLLSLYLNCFVLSSQTALLHVFAEIFCFPYQVKIRLKTVKTAIWMQQYAVFAQRKQKVLTLVT